MNPKEVGEFFAQAHARLEQNWAAFAAQIANEPGQLPSADAIAERFDVSARAAREIRVRATARRAEDRAKLKADRAKLKALQQVRTRTPQKPSGSAEDRANLKA